MKPAFEHMSRGVKLVQSESQAYETAGRLLKSLKQPILVESYIPGRELAVSLLAGPDGLQVLPIMEWGMSEGSDPILTAKFKLRDNGGANFDLNKADLPRDLLREIEAAACRAFHALGLRDYARFDVRLSHDGTPFFLEANTTPSLEPLEAFAVSAQWAGLEYSALVDRMLWGARRRSESLPSEEGKPERIKIPVREAEIQIASGVLAPPASTIKLANLLDVRPGDEVLELGCGSALLSIAAAKLGARRVVATDLDVNALEAARQTISLNGVADRIELRAGSWYEAVRGPNSAMNHEDRFDVIIATPPQTPGQYPFGPKYGGPEGLLHLSKIVRGAPVFLKENGRLWLISISLANTNELWNLLKANFSHFSIIDETRRVFTPLEYESLSEGLYGYLCGLRAAGISDFTDEGAGCLSFRNLFIRASGPSAI
jgi:methylase of polypeptide subunit release factors